MMCFIGACTVLRFGNNHFVSIFIYLQIHDEAKKFSYQTGVKVVVAYGGAPINLQVFIFLVLD